MCGGADCVSNGDLILNNMRLVSIAQALRFPSHMKRDDLETEEERADREAQEAELMAHLDKNGPDDEDDE